MRDILISSDGANAPGSSYTTGVLVVSAIASFQRITVVGFNYYNFYVLNSNVTMLNRFISIRGGTGLAVVTASAMNVNYCEIAVISNTGNGVEITNGGTILSSVFDKVYSNFFVAGNNSNGMYVGQSSTNGYIKFKVTVNNGYGLFAASKSSIQWTDATIAGNAYGSVLVNSLCDVEFTRVNIFGPGIGVLAQNASYVHMIDPVQVYGEVASYSPALGTIGNNNASIY
jgi:hypothetical protein